MNACLLAHVSLPCLVWCLKLSSTGLQCNTFEWAFDNAAMTASRVALLCTHEEGSAALSSVLIVGVQTCSGVYMVTSINGWLDNWRTNHNDITISPPITESQNQQREHFFLSFSRYIPTNLSIKLLFTYMILA